MFRFPTDSQVLAGATEAIIGLNWFERWAMVRRTKGLARRAVRQAIRADLRKRRRAEWNTIQAIGGKRRCAVMVMHEPR